MKIKNFDVLTQTSLRTAALRIVEAGLAAIDTPSLVARSVARKGNSLIVLGRTFPLGKGRVFLVGVGKCSANAAEALEPILGDRLTAGAVIDTQKVPLVKVVSYEGTHPLPSEQNISATKELLNVISGLSEEDTVIAIISGGGSALLCLPTGGRTCESDIALVKALFHKGATIEELNTVRKHTSLVRGGFLSKAAYPAQVIGLIFSDVPGDDLQFIASGPTVRDTTTDADAEQVLKKYDLEELIPEDSLVETPKDEKYFARVENIIIASNAVALEGMKAEAVGLGFETQIMSNTVQGEAREVASAIVANLHNAPAHSVTLYGGETTVHIKGSGKGGRSEEMALAGLGDIKEGELFLPFASDGRDNNDFAGGICDIMTKEHAKEKNLDESAFLEANDSYTFFSLTGDYLLTGPTESNVSDLIVAIKN